MVVLSIFGTRPEAIKLAPVISELRCRSEIVSKVCVTAQHREMLDQVLRLFEIFPDYDLNLMATNQSPMQVASSVIRDLEAILREVRPDWVLVQGDTTTAMAGALAAFYARVKVGHVEAGLRSRDQWRPFPEEINRRIAGVVADLHFAPTERSRRNLLREDVPAEKVVVTGNTVIDALRWVEKQPFNAGTISDGAFTIDSGNKLILVTVHRRESFGAPLKRICAAVREIAERHQDIVRIFCPVHRNPNVWNPVHEFLGAVPNIFLSPPIDYLPLIHLMKRSYLVVTDSGGIQEEAPAFGVPVLVLRETTERPEAVESGNVRLVGSERERIVSEAERLLTDTGEYQRMSRAVNPYGDGHAAPRIVSSLLGEHFEPLGALS